MRELEGPPARNVNEQPQGSLPFGIDHVALLTESLDGLTGTLEHLLGIEPVHEEVAKDGSFVERYLACGGSYLQLLQPLADQAMARFLQKRGPGLHHVSLRVQDIEGAARHLRAVGARIAQGPRTGGMGRPVLFLHPASFGGALLELVEVEGHSDDGHGDR